MGFLCLICVFRYGQATPPEYDLTNIKENIRLFVGTGDKLADVEDVNNLVKHLVNAHVEMTIVDKWGHCTWQMAKNGTAFFNGVIAEAKQLYTE